MALSKNEIRSYEVRGMSCDHCRSTVEQAVADIDGVDSVQVDLTSGVLEVRGETVHDGPVTSAVRAAGYEIARRNTQPSEAD